MRSIISLLTIPCMMGTMIVTPTNIDTIPLETIEVVNEVYEPEPIEEVIVEDIHEPEPIVEDIHEPEPIVEVEDEQILTDEEIELIALVTMAEAEGEPEEGKRLVIDTILNRVDGEYWPDTVTDVIYQKSQFTSMWNGRVNRCYVREDICQLVREELKSRTNNEVVFFTAGKYGKYGKPMFSIGNHYFARYD